MMNKHLNNFIISNNTRHRAELSYLYYKTNESEYLFELNSVCSNDFVFPEYQHMPYTENRFKHYMRFLEERYTNGPNS